MVLVKLIFWISLLLLFWTFLGYPLTVIFLSKIISKPWHKKAFSGTVSMVIAAHNEEDVIREKIENCMALDFGEARHEIFIVSDGSFDRTNDILREYDGLFKQLQIITYHPRKGKANALNVAVSRANGDILIFSDANVIINKESCLALLESFEDSQVGAVCGKVLVRASGGEEIAGESLYMKYEATVQRAEGLLHSMVGVDGALFALRRDLFRPLAENIILDDFTLSMQAPIAGQRIVYEDRALAVEEVVPSVDNEFKRKARIVTGGYQYLANSLKQGHKINPMMWFSFMSHKILRWTAPFFLIVTLVANIAIMNQKLFYWTFMIQVFCYLLAGLGLFIRDLRKIHLVYLPYYFFVINLAALIGFFRFLTLKEQSLWDKVERK
jgi:cellulose synthase/poly-beta-1,6-N-acetylglucosamine synthase-like glycosyltransferase